MNRFYLFEQRLRVSVLTIAAALSLSAAAAHADDATSKNVATNTPASTPPPVIRKLTGAELYAINCNRCHPERYANERTPAQWQTIMLHMRVRANIPAEQAREIVKFLQEDSGD
jgi:mono/diheme cytochrome c family protein